MGGLYSNIDQLMPQKKCKKKEDIHSASVVEEERETWSKWEEL